MFVKAKFDWLRFTTSSRWTSKPPVTPTRIASPIENARDLGYDLRDAFYTHVAKLLGIQLRRFSFVCEVADMDNCEVFEFSGEGAGAG